MEINEKVKLVINFTVILFFTVIFYSIRLRKQKNSSNSICYLETDESKPQSSFKHVLADNSYNPFKHLNRIQDEVSNSHPYEKEITALLESSSKIVEGFRFVVNGEVDLKMKGSHVWVDKEDQLKELVEVLSKERVFAVDTEQHSLRSFLGFTALMQISTHCEDYLVDTIALHDVMGILRPVFGNPTICKVFHGADNDVLWLQRDFHIYVVNLFDTAKACEVSSKPHKSLAYLLETYCGVAKNKMLQLEDWRLRPLSEEMIQYARADAHYLLYIADRMATELQNQNIENSECLDDKFKEATRLSNKTCLQLYKKEIAASPGDSAASSIISRYSNGQEPFNSETKELVERLCLWRDIMARVHDESLRYVLSDQAIVALASKAPTTATESDLNMNSCTLGSILPSPSPVVRSHSQDIFELLAKGTNNLSDVFETYIQKHLGPNESCPLSIYNYSLLTKSNLKVTNSYFAKQNGVKASTRIGRKASRQLFVQKFSCKAPVYHNCRIYASDGRLLCYCDRRKLEWYLHRDLAKLVESDPPAIILLFEPKGRPEDEDNDFYIQSKKNMCVGCGERNHYLRYRIVPSCYRVHFPEHLKSHRSHDIVLLCVDCHEIAHSAAEKHKRRVAGKFGIPLFVQKVTNTEVNSGTLGYEENVDEAGVSPLQLRSSAMALLRHGSNMPTKRREELTQIVMKFYGGRKITEEDLEKALLVGMSPHERRRLKKKRGLSFGHAPDDEANGNSADNMSTSTLADTLEYDLTNRSHSAREGKHDKQEEEILTTELDAKDINKCCDSEVKEKTSTTEGKDLNDITSIFEKGNVLDTSEELESRMSAVDRTDSSYRNGTVYPKYNKKLSLLGHGPHGKEVVDHILKEDGEDGIREFCQTWRQVFVEAINPRFLPSGWDVMHRGSRDFGEYSVFKKATTTATV
ncbi:Rrp6-like [Thalictrum thalictroides]|uniref:Rrp6-like n=1 Tax=Thalictrum thalictroides TaxID=46969 RepID=A0A7J6WXM4_THATH|nr:Rrp6-like [Thalictrum thalictroides]